MLVIVRYGISVGKVTFSEADLTANVKAFIHAVVKGPYISRISLSSTMGPGVKVDLTTVGE